MSQSRSNIGQITPYTPVEPSRSDLEPHGSILTTSVE